MLLWLSTTLHALRKHEVAMLCDQTNIETTQQPRVLKLQKQRLLWPDNTLEPSPECVTKCRMVARDLAPVTVLKYTYRRAVAVDRTLEP